MTERRFNEAEVAAILEKAAEAQHTGSRQLPSGEGMTLAEPKQGAATALRLFDAVIVKQRRAPMKGPVCYNRVAAIRAPRE